MSNISTIRHLIQDAPLYTKEQITVDGAQKSLQLYFFPVVGSSVIITPAGTAPTVDEDNGVLTWAAAPTASVLTIEYKHVFLLDAAIQAMLDLNVDADEQVRLAAADCLDAVATSQALIQKRIKLLDLETDGPALAKSLRDHAAALRKLVFDPGMSEADFDIIEQVFDQPGYVEKIFKDQLREEG